MAKTKATIGTSVFLLTIIYVESYLAVDSSHTSDRGGCPGLSWRPHTGLNYGLHGAEGDQGRMSWIFQDSGRLPYSHMVSLEQFWNNSLVAAWQVSSGWEGSDDQHVLVAFSKTKNGTEWWPPRRLPVVTIVDGAALWSPVLHADKQGTLWLFYCEARSCVREARGQVPRRWAPGGDIRATSTRTGERWSTPRTILSQDAHGGLPKVIANKIAVLSNGSWVLPYWAEFPRKAVQSSAPPVVEPAHIGSISDLTTIRSNTNTDNISLDGKLIQSQCKASKSLESAGILLSNDNGVSWSKQGDFRHPMTWLIENTVVDLQAGRLLMLFRSRAQQIFQSWSWDGGISWSSPSPTGLPNPDAKVHMITLHNSSVIALAFNEHEKYELDGFTRFRRHLRVALSSDFGLSWTRLAEVDEEDTHGWQYHYPTLLQDNCHLFIAYSKSFEKGDDYRRKEGSAVASKSGIKLFRIDLD